MGLAVAAATTEMVLAGPGPAPAAGSPAKGAFAALLASQPGAAGQIAARGPETGEGDTLPPGLPLASAPAAEGDDEGTAPPVSVSLEVALLAAQALVVPAPGNATTGPEDPAPPGSVEPSNLVGEVEAAGPVLTAPLAEAVPPAGELVAPVTADAAPLAQEPLPGTPVTLPLEPVSETSAEELAAAAATLTTEPATLDAAPLEGDALPAPGRHNEQSNRPPTLPGEAGAQAVEALQRVAARHAEAGKAPPGHDPGGSGMPALATSVVRTGGNAEAPAGDVAPAPTDAPAPTTGAAAVPIVAGVPASTTASAAGQAEAPAPPGQAAPPPPGEQVARAVIDRVSEGGGEVHIRLDPPELGEVAIRVHIDHHAVRVEVRVERPEALQLLRNAQVDLSSLLGERGLSLADLYTTLDQGNARWAGGEQHQLPPRAANGFSALLGMEEEPSTAVQQHRKLLGAYNPDGAYLYRV